MYSIMLVEDESTVRDGIVKKIDWEKHGFQLSGAFENGKLASDALLENPVDVVITDINMPVMDGLDLARFINERMPRTIVIILTGFGDFTYAQTAIRHKVHEYILKPVTAKQLRELLDKLRCELDGRRDHEAAERIKRKLDILGELETGNTQSITATEALSERQAAQAVAFIRQNYPDPGLSLQKVTSHLSVSTSYFSNIFKSYTGVTFVDFITRLRMQKAQELLVLTDMKNYEIADRVGYDDPGYFSSTFKKFTGIKPSDYRREHKTGGGAPAEK